MTLDLAPKRVDEMSFFEQEAHVRATGIGLAMHRVIESRHRDLALALQLEREGFERFRAELRRMFA